LIAEHTVANSSNRNTRPIATSSAGKPVTSARFSSLGVVDA
jgi:hypothetical protein